MGRKVVILALDALEYDIVTKQALKLLMQAEYGYLRVPILKGQNEPSTAVVWATFITGCEPSQHGITRFSSWNHVCLNWLDRFAQKVGVPLKSRMWGGQLLRKIGFKKKSVDTVRYKDIGTIFEDVPNSVAISVPSYNEWQENFRVRHNVILNTSDKTRWQPVESVLEADYSRTTQFLSKINRVDLAMVHIYFLDIIQHLYFYNESIIHAAYELAECILRAILSQTPPETLVLLISDHGQHLGHHTRYGFYSSNAILNLGQPSIECFRGLIRAYMQKKLELSVRDGRQVIIESYREVVPAKEFCSREELKAAFNGLAKMIKDREATGLEIDKEMLEERRKVMRRLEDLGYL